jgi:hypothetical protein
MSFIAYLCWLLGISVTEGCEPGAYTGGVIEACSMETEDPSVPDDGGKGVPPRHARGSNIDVSI